MFACAAAAAEEDEEEGVEPFTEDDGMVVTGFGGSACLIAGLDVEEEELELEFEDAAECWSFAAKIPFLRVFGGKVRANTMSPLQNKSTGRNEAALFPP